MGDQRTFASVAWEQKGKVTRRERFLTEMDTVIPWKRLIALVEPHYPKAGKASVFASPDDQVRMFQEKSQLSWDHRFVISRSPVRIRRVALAKLGRDVLAKDRVRGCVGCAWTGS